MFSLEPKLVHPAVNHPTPWRSTKAGREMLLQDADGDTILAAPARPGPGYALKYLAAAGTACAEIDPDLLREISARDLRDALINHYNEQAMMARDDDRTEEAERYEQLSNALM